MLPFLMPFIILIIGFALLVWGADKFVAGASALARRLGVSPLLIGLTVVAFGTSAPELAVSVTAAIQGANEIAVGNVLGSNLFNLLVVAGLSAVICPLAIEREIVRRDLPFSVVATVLLLLMMLRSGGVSRADGLILLAAFLFVMNAQIRPALAQKGTKQSSTDGGSIDSATSSTPLFLILINIVLGLVCIVIGGQMAVNGATGIARMFHLSETLIGLTIVAVGTSLPELVTSVVAAHKHQNEIAIGNVMGSNLFNILLILGASATIHPITVLPTALIDCTILLIVSALFYLPARTGKLGRFPGVVMVLTYVIYTVYLILR